MLTKYSLANIRVLAEMIRSEFAENNPSFSRNSCASAAAEKTE
jgi:hypothetical protein